MPLSATYKEADNIGVPLDKELINLNLSQLGRKKNPSLD